MSSSDSPPASPSLKLHAGEVLRWTHKPVSITRPGGGSSHAGVVTVTNYRLRWQPNTSTPISPTTPTSSSIDVSIPLSNIATIQILATGWVEISCRGPRVVNLQQTDGSYAEQDAFCRKLRNLIPSALAHLFAFSHSQQSPQEHTILYSAQQDFIRMGLDKDRLWQLSDVNAGFRLCPTYPEQLIVPANATENSLKTIAAFRSHKRIPVLTWKNSAGSQALLRSAQPNVGMFFNQRCTEDEVMLREVQCANSDSRSLFVFDARSYAASFANKAKGGGYENTEYYRDITLRFLNIGNIHVVRESYEGLLKACRSQAVDPRWFSSESTSWYSHLSLLLIGGQQVAKAIVNERASCLVHCSDGWDRTSALVSLAQLMIDPYYRTIKGFIELIEKDWICFGHLFGKRFGQPPADGSSSPFPLDEQSPVFLQWLDAVFQLLFQQPHFFEFNDGMLAEIAYHLTSSRFGTFLCNSENERKLHQVREKTLSLWNHIVKNKEEFINVDYQPSSQAILDELQTVPRQLQLWQSFLMPHLREAISEHYATARHVMLVQQAEAMNKRKLLKTVFREWFGYCRRHAVALAAARIVVLSILDDVLESAAMASNGWMTISQNNDSNETTPTEDLLMMDLSAPGSSVGSINPPSQQQLQSEIMTSSSSSSLCSMQERLQLEEDVSGFIVVQLR